MDQLALSDVLLRSLILVIVFAVAGGVAYFSTHRVATRQTTLRRLVQPGSDRFAGDGIESLRSERVQSAWNRLVDSLEARGLNLADTKDELLRKKLIAAGYNQPYAGRVYTLVRLFLLVVLPLTVLTLLWATGVRPSITKLYFVLVVSASLGLYAPALFVRLRANRRQQAIINAFPDALDMMLICVEAGLGLEAAFARVGMEMTVPHPLLAEQFGAVVLELRAGRSHEDALRRMGDRSGADDIRAFATLLVQSTKLGSSMAQTLRTYASEMREKRKLRAEERAHRLPVLISIPLVACMLPAMIGVLMLPVVIRVIRTVLPALQGS
jgi:tight adherence protein C